MAMHSSGRDFIGALRKRGDAVGPALTMSQAVVRSVDTSGEYPTLTLAMSDEESDVVPGIRYFAHYTPTVGDTVWLIIRGTDPMVIGRLA